MHMLFYKRFFFYLTFHLQLNNFIFPIFYQCIPPTVSHDQIAFDTLRCILCVNFEEIIWGNIFTIHCVRFLFVVLAQFSTKWMDIQIIPSVWKEEVCMVQIVFFFIFRCGHDTKTEAPHSFIWVCNLKTCKREKIIVHHSIGWEIWVDVSSYMSLSWMHPAGRISIHTHLAGCISC